MSPDAPIHSINKLNIAAFTQHTQALGPGNRAVIWVQGCPFHCEGCIAPNWIPFVPAIELSPEELLEKLNLDMIDGLTFSGGEPMEQASGLAALARLARRQKDLNLICYTGYRYERLRMNPPNPGVLELLSEVDVLIDGPYIPARNDSIGLRGSSNQRVLHFTQKLRDYNFETQSRRIEVRISNGELAFVGIPTRNMQTSMQVASRQSVKGHP